MQRRANAFTTNCGEGGRGGGELEAARQGESGGETRNYLQDIYLVNSSSIHPLDSISYTRRVGEPFEDGFSVGFCQLFRVGNSLKPRSRFRARVQLLETSWRHA
jgi:hypothetical protein